MPFGINFSVTNLGAGFGSVLIGLQALLTGTAGSTTAITTNPVVGTQIQVAGGQGTGTTFFQGSVRGHVITLTCASTTIGTPIIGLEGYRSSGGTIVRSGIGFYAGFHQVTSPNLTFSATLANNFGFLCDALTSGTTRVQYQGNSIITGTPSSAITFRSVYHAVGTLRRSLLGDNSIECSSGHVMTGVSGTGVVVKDTIDGNYYLLTTASGIIGASSIGATLPAL